MSWKYEGRRRVKDDFMYLVQTIVRQGVVFEKEVVPFVTPPLLSLRVSDR